MSRQHRATVNDFINGGAGDRDYFGGINPVHGFQDKIIIVRGQVDQPDFIAFIMFDNSDSALAAGLECLLGVNHQHITLMELRLHGIPFHPHCKNMLSF